MVPAMLAGCSLANSNPANALKTHVCRPFAVTSVYSWVFKKVLEKGIARGIDSCIAYLKCLATNFSLQKYNFIQYQSKFPTLGSISEKSSTAQQFGF